MGLPPLEDDAAAPAVVDIRHLPASDLLVLQLPVVGSRHRFPQDAQDPRRELRLDGLQRCLAGLFNTHFCVDPASGVCGSIYSNFVPFPPSRARAASW